MGREATLGGSGVCGRDQILKAGYIEYRGSHQVCQGREGLYEKGEVSGRTLDQGSLASQAAGAKKGPPLLE